MIRARFKKENTWDELMIYRIMTDGWDETVKWLIEEMGWTEKEFIEDGWVETDIIKNYMKLLEQKKKEK